MPSLKRIDHVAVLVDDLDRTLSFWRDALGVEVSRVVEVPEEASRIAILPIGDSAVELVQPIDDESGLRRFLEKRGPGMHHVCLEVDDIAGMLVQLKAKGVQLINETPVSGVEGRKYAFIHPKSSNGVLVELYELSD